MTIAAEHVAPLSRRALAALALAGAGSAAAQAVDVLPAVTVSSTRTERTALETPASVSLVDGIALREGKPMINLSESLAAVPGLQAQNRNNYAQDLQISIRGFGARSTFGIRGVRIYVDGIPATMPDGQGQISNVDLASAERVEVLRGPYSALYGNSSGGVILIDTAPGEGPLQTGARFGAGSYGSRYYGMQAGGGTGFERGLTDYRLSANRFLLDGYRDHSAVRRTLSNARLGLALGERSTLTLVANSLDQTAQDPLGLSREEYEADRRAATPNAELYDTRKTSRQSQLGARLEHRLDGGARLALTGYYGERGTVQYQAIPYFVQRANPGHAGGVIDLRRRYGGLDLRGTRELPLAGGGLTVIGGLAYDRVEEDRKGYENFVGDGPVPDRLGVKGRLRRDERNTLYSVDPYAQLSWQPDERWTLEGGLRYSTVRFRSRDRYLSNGDDSGDSRYSKALPVAAVRYAVSPDVGVYATAGRGFETPTFNELSYRPDGTAGLNLGLQPSTSRNYEIGVKANAGGGLFSAALFHIDTKDEIVSAGSFGGRATFANAGRTRRQGVELAWEGELARHLYGQASYTWLDAVLRDREPGQGRYIPGVARQGAYAALNWAPPEGWRAGVEWRYLHSLYADTANTARAPGYATTGVYAGYLLRAGPWELSAFARVDNLFDRRYIGSVIVNESNGRYYEPAPGRNWSAALSADYRF